MKRATVFRLFLALTVIALTACSGKEESKPAPEPEPEQPAPSPAAAEPAPAPEAAEQPEPEAEAESMTPEEIELARKSALMEGRAKDAIKYCEMAGIKAGESDDQAVFGCAMAACQVKDADKARAWTAELDGPLMDQAKKTCQKLGVPL